VLFATETVDGGRVFGEPPVEELAIGKFHLKIGRKHCPKGSENPPVAQATEFVAQGPARHLLGVGPQDGI
jgi:hypothetical protein